MPTFSKGIFHLVVFLISSQLYPSNWSISSGAIVARIKADLEVFKRLADAKIASFLNLRYMSFGRQEMTIFCMVRHMRTSLQQELLVNFMKNLDEERIYDVLVDPRFYVKQTLFF